MVIFPPSGRMGNFLFEAACALSYSLKHNLDFTVPFKTNSDVWNPIYLKHLQNNNYDSSLEQIIIPEMGHEYQELPFEESWRNKNIIIEGYRQSAKYINGYRDAVLYAFDFPYEKKDGIVSLHVRRGDYVLLTEKHPVVSPQWYFEAMELFPGKTFKIFSDDMTFVKETFGHRQDCIFSTNHNEVDDLIEASCCESQISSSSTFSWWIAYLNRNPDKKIIIPKLWFVEGHGGLEVADIVPNEWTKL